MENPSVIFGENCFDDSVMQNRLPKETYKALLAALGRQGLLPTSPPLELYRIDAHDTSLEAEYLTEIQVQVKEQLS